MMPFLYPTQPAAFPILIIANQNYLEDDEQEEQEEEDFLTSSTTILSRIMPIPMTALPSFINTDEQIPPSTPNEHQNAFRLRMNVDGFQPNELKISIRHGRLIVRGKHVVRALTQSPPAPPPFTTNSIINGNDDTEPDFVAKEFKRTFTIPSNTDVRRAHAQFYPQQQLLVIEIPFQNSTDSSQTRSHRTRIRLIDVFLAIVTILLMDRAVRITFEQFMMNERQLTNTSSQNRRRRENHDIFF